MSSSMGSVEENRVVGGKYRVDCLLGCGAFGNAYLAEDIAAKKWKVLKEIRCTECQKNALESSVREAKLLAKLQHPGILRYLDSFLGAAHPFQYFYIVTEYCEGGDLEEKILAWKAQGKVCFDESLVLDWFIQLMMAVQYMHHKKVLHRDLKTRNLFLKNNMVKVGDFGISKMLTGTSDMAQTFIGTLYYMSPEVLRHENYNAKSDVWAAGCILHELCTLEKTFEAAGLLGVMRKITEGSPTPVGAAHFSPDMGRLVTAMLHKSPEQRPTASQVLKAPLVMSHMKSLKSKMNLARDVKEDKTTGGADKAKHRSLGSAGKTRTNDRCNNTELPWVAENPEVFNSTAFKVRPNPPRQFLAKNTVEDVVMDDVDITDEDNMSNFLQCMENALEKSEHDENMPGDPSEFSVIQQKSAAEKIETLRSQCLIVFGDRKFLEIYRYLKHVRYSSTDFTEEDISSQLKDLWDNVLDCSLIDQLIFLEEKSKIQ